MNRKISQLRIRMEASGIEGLIISNPINIRYLTGLEAEGYLLINENENFFVTDARYIEKVNSKLTIEDEIIAQDGKDLDQDDFLNFFNNAQKVGFEEDYVTYEKYQRILIKYRPKELVEASRIIENMRIIKSEDEIEKIEKACNITDSCYLHILDHIKIGMTELYNPDIIGTGKGKILDGPYKGKDFAIKGGSIGPINVISRLLGYDS